MCQKDTLSIGWVYGGLCTHLVYVLGNLTANSLNVKKKLGLKGA